MTNALQKCMENTSPEPMNQICAPCQIGNQLWLENLSDQSASVTFSINGKSSSILPQTALESTKLINTLEGTTGKLEIAINGKQVTFLEDIDQVSQSTLTNPNQLKAGLIIGAKSQTTPKLIKARHTAIPFSEKNNSADLSKFLPIEITENNTDIDIVMICQASESLGAINKEGEHNVEALGEPSLKWLLDSLALNTISSSANELGYGALFARDIAKEFGRDKIITALKEIIFKGKFHVKKIASWGGKYAIIFKGAHRSRSFITAISYGLNNKKMSYLNSFAEYQAAKQSGGIKAGVASASRSAAKSNFIGFAISAAFDISDFWKSEDPEKNWGDLLGALGVTFVKVWLAGMAGIIGATLLAAGATMIAGATLPVFVVVGLGLSIAVAAGVILDWVDGWIGIKSAVEKIGRSFANVVNKALAALFIFVKKAMTNVEGMINTWIVELEADLRQNDPQGWCALFCPNQLDQFNAWIRGLGGRGISRF